MITYSTPKFNGFTADVQLGLGAKSKVTSASGVVDTTNDGKENSTAFALNYANGPFAAKFGTETVNNFSKSVKVAGYEVAKPTGMADRKNDAFGLSYDLGMAKVYFLNTRMKQGDEASKVSFDTNNFGVRVPMGAFTFNAGLSDGKAKLTGSTVKADMSATQFSLWYAMNNETMVYAVYGQESIKHPTFAVKSDDKTMLVGIRYKF